MSFKWTVNRGYPYLGILPIPSDYEQSKAGWYFRVGLWPSSLMATGTLVDLAAGDEGGRNGGVSVKI